MRNYSIAGMARSYAKFVLLALFAVLCPLSSVLWSAEAHFVWSPNTETNMAGYKIYYGTASRQYSDLVDVGKGVLVAGKVYGTVTGLTAGTTYYFAATAYNTDGFQSDYSQEVTWTAVDQAYPASPELMLTILRRNPDGTVDLLDAQGTVIAVGVKLP